VTSQGGTTNAYNLDGTLVAQTSGETTRYAQDLASPLSQVLSIGATRYVYGHERLAAQSGGVTTWYVADALGSLRQTLDSTGTPRGTASYDPWGTPQGGTISCRADERLRMRRSNGSAQQQWAGNLRHLWTFLPRAGLRNSPDQLSG
jgi:hypothetical protein